MKEMIGATSLSEKQLQDIKELENACSRYEKLSMKLNWDMLNTRAHHETNDFLYYENNQLIGFLGLYGFGPRPKEIELTGMVHPEHRRRGIFKGLFNEAKKVCHSRDVERILIITERSCPSGTGFTKSTGAVYSFSEYRMKFNEMTVPSFIGHGITLRKAESRDYPTIKKMDALCFGASDDSLEEESSSLQDSYRALYISELDGKFIGKIGTTMEGEDGYIFGFVVAPEYRGKGFGRETLSLALLKLQSMNIHTILLEVAVQNENALSLYKSCGFKEDTVYDYYELKL